MNTTKQLADALRDAILCVDPHQNPETFKCARDALAAYDAQQAQPVSVTTMDVDRVLGMADQFLEDWRESVDDDTARDSELEEREQEWSVIRALILHRVNAHDALVSALRGVMPYAENEVSAILDLADNDDEHADEECEQATAALESARAALEAAGSPNA